MVCISRNDLTQRGHCRSFLFGLWRGWDWSSADLEEAPTSAMIGSEAKIDASKAAGAWAVGLGEIFNFKIKTRTVGIG